jgi:hypothetical protein
MKCPVCNDHDFEHRLDLEKHSLGMHGVSAEKLMRESASGPSQPTQLEVVGKSASREH